MSLERLQPKATVEAQQVPLLGPKKGKHSGAGKVGLVWQWPMAR